MSERLTTDRRLWRVIIASALAMFLVNLDFFAVQVALPDMSADLNTDVANLQWVISGYMLSLAAFLIVAGRLADLLGRKTWLIIGTSIFGLTSLIGGFAASAEIIIIMRILQGVGAAILMPVCLAVVTNAFPAEKVQRAIGMVFGIAAIGQAGGPLVGGLLTEFVSWRWVLWLNVPVAIFVVYLAVTSVRQSFAEDEERRIDWLGLVLVVFAIGVFTFGIDEASVWGWGSPLTWSFIAVGLIIGIVFLWWETKYRPPLMDLTLFRIREFSVMIGAGMAGNMTAVVAIFVSMIYLQTDQGFSPLQAGLAFMIYSGGITISAQVAGRLERFTSWKVMVLALAMGGIGAIAMGLLTGSIVAYLVVSFFAGLGLGMTWTYTNVVTQSVVPKSKAGEASGIVLTVLIGMGGVATAIASSLTATGLSGGGSPGSVIGSVLIGFGIFTLIFVPLVAFLGRDRKSTPDSKAPASTL